MNPPEIFVGAGDISSCGTNNDEATAQLLDTIPGTVYVLGDNVYENGSTSEFANCYNPTWGRHKARTKPSAGNHEYNTSGAAPYFAYFGAAAGEPGKGYYSFDLGAWHIIVLNSNIARSPGSAQDLWLQNDLVTHPNLCTLAYWHHALYGSDKGSGTGGTVYNSVRPYLDRLYPAGADLVLSGHRHFYERLAPMKADGSPDNAFGVRQFIAGSGGIGGATITTNLFPTSEAVNGVTRGVLKLYLYDDSYAWKFIPITGQTFTDSGSTACHGAPGSGGGVSASLSTVSAAPTPITAGSGSSTITVTVKNSSGSAISGATVVLSATGTGNTLTQPSGTTNSSGVATGTLSSTVTGSKTVSATANGTAITQTASVTVTAGPLSASQSTVTASPTSFVAGGGSSTITVTAKDANGNPISGASVVLAATGTGNTLTQPSGTTNTSGVTTGTLGSTVAETKTVSATINGTAVTQTASVTVTPPGSGGTITQTLLTSGGNGTNQSSYTTASISPTPNALITVAVVGHQSSAASASPTVTGGGMSAWSEVATITLDQVATPHKRMSIFRAMSGSPGSGPITITFPTAQSNAVWIVSQWTGVDPAGTNGSGAIAQAVTSRADNVTTIGATLAAFGSPSNVAYSVVGTNGAAIGITPGAGFTEISEQSSNESPRSILEAQWAANNTGVSGTWSGALAAAILAIEVKAAGGGAPTVSASQSTVTASPTSIIAGSATSTITVTAKDGGGNPISGATVVLAATGSGNNLTQPVGTTDVSGQITGTLSSTGAGDKVVSATIGGVAITQQATVTVTPGVAAGLAFTTQPTNTGANAPITPAVVVEVRDAFGNRVNSSASITMAIGTNPSSGTLAGTLTHSAVAGVATFSDLAINNSGNGYALVASSSPLTGASSSTFNITAQAPSASLSTVVAATPSFTAGGSSLITITVKDGTNTPMSGVTVTLSSTVVGDAITQPATTTDGSGVTTGTVSATSAGNRSITAVAGGVTLDQNPIVTVTAGPADGGQSTISATPTSITAGSGTSTITVTVKDAFGNPVSNSAVALSAPGTNVNLGNPSGPANPSGLFTSSLSSTDPQTVNVSATADLVPIAQSATVTVTPPGSSTIAHTLLTAGSNVTNAKIYTTASIAPAANALVTIAVIGHQSAAASASPTISGGGMSAWVEVATITFDNVATPKKRMSVFRAMSATPGSGPITINFPTTESNASWIISQWTGVDQSGTNGSGAIAQALTSRLDAANSVSATLAALGSPSNVAYGVLGTNGSAIGISSGAGFAEISEQKPAESPNSILQAQWAANSTLVSGSWTGSFAAAILAIEIKAAP